MSAIASFYLVPDSRLPDVVAAAKPTSRRWLGPARDTFWEVLRGSCRELERFTAGSGWVFNTLDLYLENRYGCMYGQFGDGATGDVLSQARGSYWLALPSAAASQLLGALNQVDLSLSDLLAFITSEHGSEQAAEEAAAVQAAVTTFKGWLVQVPAGTTGLLSVG